MKKVTYGNGFVVEYVYDTLENLKEVWYTESGSRKQAYEYTYNAYGQLIRSDDLLSGRSAIYRYDTSGKLVHYVECNSKALTVAITVTARQGSIMYPAVITILRSVGG